MSGNLLRRVIVADDDARVRSALHTLLKQEPGPYTIREISDAESLVATVNAFRPDVVLLDWELPGRPAAVLLFALNGFDHRPKVIVLSKRPEVEQAALAAGADAFVSKGDPPDQLLSAFRALTGS